MKKRKLTTGVIAGIMIAAIGFVYGNYAKLKVTGIAFDNLEALSNSEEIIITCGQMGTRGYCWKENYMSLRFCGEYSYYECEFTGMQTDYCWQPC